MKISIKIFSLTFFLSLLVMTITPAFAATYYVATNGSDSNNGSATAPWATFSYAIGQMSSGDKLIVKAGTYNQAINVNKSGITIQGELDGNGNHLTFINPGTVLSSWTSVGSGVYRATYNQEASSMIVEIDDKTYDIGKLCTNPSSSYCEGWLSKLQTPANATITNSGYPNSQTFPWWDGLEALYASDGSYIYMRFRDSVLPTTKGTIRVTPLGATIRLGAYSNITIKNLKIKASQYGILIDGGANNTIDNNIIINGQRKVQIEDSTSTNYITNNTMYAQSYSTYVKGDYIGYGTGGFADQAPTQAQKTAAAINYHNYGVYKYDSGQSSSCYDECGVYIIWASNVIVTGNDIYEGDDGVLILNSHDIEIGNNTIHDLHGNGIFLGNDPAGEVNLTGMTIHDNFFYNCNFAMRFHQMETNTHGANVYNNRSWQPQRVGGHINFSINVQYATVSGTKTIWFYHNVFSGGYVTSDIGSWLIYLTGNPFTYIRFVDNIMSTYTFEQISASVTMGACDYNWRAFDSAYSGTDWCTGSNNFYNGSTLMWNTTEPHNFSITTATAINAGIDISESFTIEGTNYPALPGFSSGYFSGSKPNMGAVQQSPVSDTQPPTTPSNLTATAISSTQINLSWSASTDNVGVTGYKIYRNGTQISISTLISYSDTGLSPSTTYTYTVSAFDAAGNVSAQSISASATTQSTIYNLTVRAKGSYASGWPNMEIWVDGVKAANTLVNTTTYTDYNFSISSNPKKIDVVFTNDYYDPATGADRNLYVDYIIINGKTIQAEDPSVILDKGSGSAAFDGINTIPGQEGIFWDAALRFNISDTIPPSAPSGLTVQ